MEKRLYRSRKDKMAAGVCSGVAEYFNIDPTIARVVFAVIAFTSFGTAAIAYFIAMIVIPEAPVDMTTTQTEQSSNASEQRFTLNSKDSRQTLGFVLIGAGGLILLSRMVNWFDSNMIIAVGIIAVGIFIITKRNDK